MSTQSYNPIFAKVVAVLMALAVTSCGKRESPAAQTIAPQEEKPPVSVESVAVGERMMPRYLQIIGELQSGFDSAVASDGAGKVVETLVERGTLVQKGDVLVRLDDRQAKLQLREAEAGVTQAQARLELSEAELKRNEPLAKTKAIADADFQKLTADTASARADFEAAQARRDTSLKAVDDAVIRAPFAGTVAERRVSVGEYVQASTQVVRLVAVDKLRLIMNVPEVDVGRLKEGQPVSFRVPAYADKTFEGSVKFVSPVVRETTRDLMVEAEVPNPEGTLRQGMFADGRLHVGSANTLVAPTRALRTEAGVSRVLVIEKEQLVERLVDTGEVEGEWTQIVQGLKKGETIVVNAGPEAVDGAKVKIAATGQK